MKFIKTLLLLSAFVLGCQLQVYGIKAKTNEYLCVFVAGTTFPKSDKEANRDDIFTADIEAKNPNSAFEKCKNALSEVDDPKFDAKKFTNAFLAIYKKIKNSKKFPVIGVKFIFNEQVVNPDKMPDAIVKAASPFSAIFENQE